MITQEQIENLTKAIKEIAEAAVSEANSTNPDYSGMDMWKAKDNLETVLTDMFLDKKSN